VSFLKPSKKKVLLSLIPFYILLFPFALFLLLDIIPILMWTPFAVFAIAIGLLFFFIYGTTFGAPFEKILEKIGLVHHYGSMFDINFPDVSFLGIIVTGVFYSLLIYLCISFIQLNSRNEDERIKKKSDAGKINSPHVKIIDKVFKVAVFLGLAIVLMIFARAVYYFMMPYLE